MYVFCEWPAAARKRIWIAVLFSLPFLPILSMALPAAGFPSLSLFSLFPAEGNGIGAAWKWIAAAYVSAVAVFAAFILVQLARIARWIQRGKLAAGERVAAAFARAAERIGHKRHCTVILLDDIQTPFALRTFYPVIALPTDFARDLTDDELLAAAIHELTHIKRNDPFWLATAAWLRALFFFQPLVWMATREMSVLAEESADDAVLAHTRSPMGYARLLMRLAEKTVHRMLASEFAVGIVFTKSVLLRRIEMVLSERPAWSGGVTPRGCAGFAALVSPAVLLALTLNAAPAGLMGTEEHAKGMTFRHLWDLSPEGGLSGTITRDGRLLSHVDWNAGNLSVYDLERLSKQRSD